MKHKYPKDADGDSLRLVAASGNDMAQPMVIDFFVVVPDRSSGKKVAKAASLIGYHTSVEQDEESGEWTCYCTQSMLATYEGVVNAQRELGDLSEPFGGLAEGWGTFGNVEEC